uniref:LITAF domain-containing protein n=1 Tax=Echeneis naucrates TaxID=173247 RepID=A0A665W7I8_ECHNA
MEPPSYEEASLHPPPLTTAGVNIPPPPSYDASLSSRSTPPPTYGEAGKITSHYAPAFSIFLYSSSDIEEHSPTVTEVPVKSPISLCPGLICCPYCRHTVTTKVTYVPGATAWFLCVLLTLMGLVCGFCLIPLMIHRLHEAHHSCPRCGNHLHVYTR